MYILSVVGEYYVYRMFYVDLMSLQLLAID